MTIYLSTLTDHFQSSSLLSVNTETWVIFYVHELNLKQQSSPQLNFVVDKCPSDFRTLSVWVFIE